MANEELIEYIKARKEQGSDKDEIIAELKGDGWSDEDITGSFLTIEVPSPGDVPKAPEVSVVENSSNTDSIKSMDSSQKEVPFDDFGGIIKKALNIYIGRLSTFFGILLVPSFFLFFVTIMFLGGDAMGVSLFDSNPLAIIPVIFIAVAIIVFLSVFGQVALLVSIHNKTGITESYKRALSIFSSYVWITFLVGLAVMGGMILFIVPGIIFSIWFGMATFVLVVDGAKGIDALNKSREYVRGHGWQVFAYSFLFLLIMLGATLVINIPIGLLTASLANSLNIGWVGDLVQQITSLILQPLGYAFGYTLFMSLRANKGVQMEDAGKKKSKGMMILLVIGGVVAGMVIVGGILSSIVLASLNTARGKGNDASIKANLSSMRAQAELYYDDGGYGTDSRGYEGYCEDFQARDSLMAAENSGGDAACNDSKQGWVAWAALTTDKNKYFCVDSNGVAREVHSALLKDSTTECPNDIYFD